MWHAGHRNHYKRRRHPTRGTPRARVRALHLGALSRDAHACALAVIFLGFGRTLSGRDLPRGRRDRAHHNTCGTRQPQLHRQHPHLLRRHEPPRSAVHPRRKLPPRSRHCRLLAGGYEAPLNETAFILSDCRQNGGCFCRPADYSYPTMPMRVMRPFSTLNPM